MALTDDSQDTELALPELILALKGDRTYKQLEADSGGVVKAQRWQQLATGERVHEFPEPPTLNAMAAALPCDVEVLLLAVARTVGIPVRHRKSRFVDMLPPSVDTLSARSQGALLTLARSLTAAEHAGNGGGGAVPPPGRRRPRPGLQPL